MNEQMMELVDRVLLLTEENAKMRERINHLAAAVADAERKDAKYSVEHGYSYSANLSCDKINAIMSWNRDKEAERILNTRTEAANEG